MILHYLSGKLAPANTVSSVGHKIPSFFALMIKSHTIKICIGHIVIILSIQLHRMFDLIRLQCKCKCMRRLKTILLECTQMQSGSKHLHALYGRHTRRHQIQLIPKL